MYGGRLGGLFTSVWGSFSVLGLFSMMGVLRFIFLLCPFSFSFVWSVFGFVLPFSSHVFLLSLPSLLTVLISTFVFFFASNAFHIVGILVCFAWVYAFVAEYFFL